MHSETVNSKSIVSSDGFPDFRTDTAGALLPSVPVRDTAQVYEWPNQACRWFEEYLGSN